MAMQSRLDGTRLPTAGIAAVGASKDDAPAVRPNDRGAYEAGT
jgi:hypothetical protein